MPNNLEIPWKKFSEEEIQTLIAMLFHSLEYHVEELHKSDRANEGGADVIAKKGDESIAIAVKIKPCNDDRPQLIDLSRRKEEEKIYVYINTPTKKFLEFAKNYNKIKFFDIKKLNDFFLEKNMYFTANIIFDNHPINQKLSTIQLLLYHLWEKSLKSKKKKVKRLDKESVFMLWRLKDVSVILNQINYFIGILFETPINNKNEELNSHFLKIFLDYLDILESKISRFILFFTNFYLKNKELVDNSIIEQKNRSHWLWISHHQPLNNLKTLKKELNEAIEEQELYNDLVKRIEKIPKDEVLEDYEEKVAKGNDIWQAIHSKIKNLSLFGSGVEEIVDDIIKEYFHDYNTL